MSKILSALIVGLFAATAFAADVPPPATQPGLTQTAPAKVSAHKRHHRHHKHHVRHGHKRHHHAAAAAAPMQ